MIGQTSALEQVSVADSVRELLAKPPEALRRTKPKRTEIGGHDEAALSWYFGQGLSIYEKSTFGPIVQKIQMDGFASTMCAKCEGTGILEKGGVRLEDRCRGCEGSGKQPRKTGEPQHWCSICEGLGKEPPYEVETKHGWCTSCRGTGAGSVERRAMRRSRCSWCRPEPAVVVEGGVTSRYELITARPPTHACPNCIGTGDEPLTAKRLQKDDEAGGVIGDDSALTSFAITSRRMDAIKQRSPALFAAGEAFYGDTGARWALTDFGRIFALYHLTNAGKRLARWDQKPTAKTPRPARRRAKAKRRPAATMSPHESPHLTAQEAIGVHAHIERRQPNRERRKLLESAQEQAVALYQRFCAAWLAVAVSKSDKDATKRLASELERLGHKRVADHVRSAR
jgi:hypothetical protein